MTCTLQFYHSARGGINSLAFEPTESLGLLGGRILTALGLPPCAQEFIKITQDNPMKSVDDVADPHASLLGAMNYMIELSSYEAQESDLIRDSRDRTLDFMLFTRSDGRKQHVSRIRMKYWMDCW